MRHLVTQLLFKASSSPGMQKLLDNSLVKASHFYERNRMRAVAVPDAEQYKAVYESLGKELKVRTGPFAGMKYPRAESAGSALIPKFLGSYEKELHGEIERLLAKGYDDVIDVGCAEGYYAIGMAMRLPATQVYAYDTSEVACGLCTEMAKVNGVSERVSVRATCTPETLIQFPKPGKTLIIADCESYEKVLFTPAVRDAVKGCDLLIETHDFLDVSISTNLAALFSSTHKITTVLSVDDIQKAKYYQYPELEGLSVQSRFQLLAESRPTLMEWLIMEPL